MKGISLSLTDEMWSILRSEDEENLCKHIRSILQDYLIKKGYKLTQEIPAWGKGCKKDKSC